MRRLVIVCALLALVVSGCVADAPTPEGAPGFFDGLWDGIVAPWAFLANLFGSDYGIYENLNSGGWYDFGFLLGIGALGGAAASTAR